MQKLSLRKIIRIVIVIFLLANLEAISSFLGSVCSWFATSLNGLNNFSEGAQTAIAVAITGLVIVVTLRVFNK